MTLLSVVKDVCANVGVLIPTSVFSNLTTNRTMQEMLSLANETAQEIAYDTRDWTFLTKTQIFNGDGVNQAFDLPANYKRMLLTAQVYRSTSALQPMRFIPDANEWLQRRMNNYTEAYGEWTMQGGQMLIWPVMGTGTSARFVYMDKNCIKLNSGGYGDTFMDDADSFVLDERTFKLGMTWRWKQNKGAAYQEDLATFGDALSQVLAKDKPAPIIIGRKPMSANVTIAYPWQVPTP